MSHIPVLAHEVIDLLNIQQGDVVVDGTLNGGGHAREILKLLGPKGKLVGIDWDKTILKNTERELGRTFICGNYADTKEILHAEHIEHANAILLDLGFSSHQISDPSRGFSIQHDGPLDMRYNVQAGDPAHAIINSFSEDALADIFFTYGEERRSRKIAHAIVEHRKKKRITHTGQLWEIIQQAIYPHTNRDMALSFPKRKIAIGVGARVFQALRIYVNNELGNLKKFLHDLPTMITPKGRCAIISFHSLEDRIIKNSFRDFKKEGIVEILTKKPITPTAEERAINPRSRSAKLRAIKKI